MAATKCMTRRDSLLITVNLYMNLLIKHCDFLKKNKDIKAVDSGVYASVRTAKMPYMNARKLRDGLVKNGENLERNLNTALAAVRNTPQYWKKIRSDAYAIGIFLKEYIFQIKLYNFSYW